MVEESFGFPVVGATDAEPAEEAHGDLRLSPEDKNASNVRRKGLWWAMGVVEMGKQRDYEV